MAKNIVIYHDNCVDGIVAAWAAWTKLGSKAEYVAAKYDATPDMAPLVGNHIYLVDFSYKRDICNQIIEQAESLTIIDHHLGARDELAIKDIDKQKYVNHPELHKDIRLVFNMEHCGAMLTWLYFHGTQKERPPTLDYVENYDLWKFVDGDDSLKFQLGFRAYQKEWHMDRIQEMMYNPEPLIKDGASIFRYQSALLDMYIERGGKIVKLPINEHQAFNILLVNAPNVLASQLGNKLAEYHGSKIDMVCVWDYEAEFTGKVKCSFRSINTNVLPVAKFLGGGGHEKAGSTNMPLSKFLTTFRMQEIINLLKP